MQIEEQTTNIGNCPHCTKIIFKDAVFNSEATFTTRCPHCNKSVKVIIRHKVEIVLVAMHDDRKPKPGPGTSLVVFILVLYLPPIIHRLANEMDNILDLIS